MLKQVFVAVQFMSLLLHKKLYAISMKFVGEKKRGFHLSSNLRSPAFAPLHLNLPPVVSGSGTSGTSKQHRFQTLKSPKTDKKQDSKKQLSNDKHVSQYVFLSQIVGSQTGSLGGVL